MWVKNLFGSSLKGQVEWQLDYFHELLEEMFFPLSCLGLFLFVWFFLSFCLALPGAGGDCFGIIGWFGLVFCFVLF